MFQYTIRVPRGSHLDVRALLVATALASTALAAAAGLIAPAPGLKRSFYRQAGFVGTPIVQRVSDISLEFLNERTDLPRQSFSVRWEGVLFVRHPGPIEFFAGGNDEVAVRIDGQPVLRRDLGSGFRTVGRTIALDVGAHEIAIDYQQFGGGMALNIQRAIADAPPSPFLPNELYTEGVGIWRVRVADVAWWLNRFVLVVWGLVAIAALPWLFERWRVAGGWPGRAEYVRRLGLIAAPALLAPFVVFIVGPHTIYTSNRGEFSTGFGALALPWLLRTTVLTWLILFIIGSITAMLSERLTRIYGGWLLAFGLLLWGQGHLWNADYGVLTGTEIDLGPHAWRTPYELAGWSAAMLVALVFFRPVSRIASFAALVFMGVQLAGTAVSTAAPATTDHEPWTEPPPAIFQFSSRQNIIHIVLDEFQSDLFTEMMQQHRATFDRQFSGFEYFSDHAGTFPTTSFAIPSMLTSHQYRNEKPAPEFTRESFDKAPLFDEITRAGYEVDVVSIVPTEILEQWIGPEATPRWKGERFRIRKPFVSRNDYREASARQLLALSLFRHLPHSMKESVTRHPARFDRVMWTERRQSTAEMRIHEAANSVAFLRQFTATMSAGRERPVYKLLHVGVPHRPLVVDRECRFTGPVDFSRQPYLDQAGCAIKLVGEFLDRARALGIYDRSLVIVSSDHGTNLSPLGFGGTSDSLSLVPGPSTSPLPEIAGTANALMLIKRPNRTGPIAMSEAPTTHTDLPATILDALGLGDNASSAGSMFRREPAQPRTRAFGMYHPQQRFLTGYLERLDVLSINGKVIDAAAWNVEHTIWPPDVTIDARDIDVGLRESHRFLGPGWSFGRTESAAADAGVTYASPVTKRAVIFVSLPPGTLQLTFTAASNMPQSVRLEIDGRETGRLQMPGGNRYSDQTVSAGAGSRPKVSELVLCFEPTENGQLDFKLDRLLVGARSLSE